MSVVWIISMVLLWVMVALLGLLVLSLIRQIGELTLQINALREERTDYPKLYSRLPPHEVSLIDGRKVFIGGEQSRASLLVVFSTTCGAVRKPSRCIAPARRRWRIRCRGDRHRSKRPR